MSKESINRRRETLVQLLHLWRGDPEAHVFRISMGADLDRVQKFGSSRMGWSDMAWKEQSVFPNYTPMTTVIPPRHDQFIIASPWADLWEDADLDDGTMAHKFQIYKDPFFTIYRKEGLREVGKEPSPGLQNQGTHFEFLRPPLDVLDSVWCVADVLKFT